MTHGEKMGRKYGCLLILFLVWVCEKRGAIYHNCSCPHVWHHVQPQPTSPVDSWLFRSRDEPQNQTIPGKINEGSDKAEERYGQEERRTWNRIQYGKSWYWRAPEKCTTRYKSCGVFRLPFESFTQHLISRNHVRIGYRSQEKARCHLRRKYASVNDEPSIYW